MFIASYKKQYIDRLGELVEYWLIGYEWFNISLLTKLNEITFFIP